MARIGLLLFALFWGGCDLFGEPDRTLLAEGTVVSAETGEPLSNIVVQIRGSSGVFSPIFAADTSDAQGRFRAFDPHAALRRSYFSIVSDLRLLEPGSDPEYYTLTSGQNNDRVEVGKPLRDLRLEMRLTQRD